MSVLVAIIVFSVIILVHELGHFLAARRVGIEVEEFSIGFGPKLAGFSAAGTQFSIRVIPMGGYVRMLGEEGEEEEANSDNPASYQNKSPLQRMAVIAAGPAMNFVLALVIFVLIFGVIGGVTLNEPRIGAVLPDMPAEAAGLQAGDEIVRIDSQEMARWTDVQQYIRANPGKTLTFVVSRQGRQLEIVVTPRMGEKYSEVGIAPPVGRLSILASIKEGFIQTFNLTREIFKSLVGIITRRVPAEDITGPIGIVYFVGQAAKDGLINVLYLAALISVNLGLFNLLPIPALDGSKLVFLGVELIRRRPLDPHKEGLVHLVGFALLISLMLFVMYRDIIRFIL
ncbi:MAG: RIP metalloprotease RseP [Bacillota bacterium]|jgi:regulator of sigma E protease